jgi:hypothetical protein
MFFVKGFHYIVVHMPNSSYKLHYMMIVLGHCEQKEGHMNINMMTTLHISSYSI